MRLKIFNLFCCVFSFYQLNAQDDSSYTSIADGLFKNLNKWPIKTGILYDRVFPFAALHVFNTLNMDTSNFHHWRQAYYELYNASYNNAEWITPDSLNNKVSGLTSNTIIPIGILNYSFNQIDTNAIEKNLISERDELFYDVPGRRDSPYWLKEISMISVLTESVVGLSVKFQTPVDLFLRNTRHTISMLQADFNDGIGLRKINLNSKFVVNYKSYGEKTLKFVIKYSDSKQITTYSTLKIVEGNKTTISLLSPLNSCDRDSSITATIPFNDYQNRNFKGKGNYRYYFATNRPCNGKVHKPFIVLDGFDYNDENTIDSIYNLLNRDTEHPLAKTLQMLGYDVIILNFPTYTNELGQKVKGGGDYIERNAMVLVELINKLNKELLDNGSTEKMVILAPSMGGLISRYALAYMEKENMPHNTRLWVSLDAPHNGANIPLGVQYFVRFFERDNADAKHALARINSPAAKQMLLHHHTANSVKAQGAPGFRDRFNQALVNNGLQGSNGFPTIPRKVALVDGSLSGALQSNAVACERVFRLKAYLVINLFLTKLKIKVADASIFYSGSYNEPCRVHDGWYGSKSDIRIRSDSKSGTAPLNTVSYDIAPGGKRYTLQQLVAKDTYDELIAGNVKAWLILLKRELIFLPSGVKSDFDLGDSIHCFIPTKSALAFTGDNQDLAENVYIRDLVCTGETPFDTYFGDSKNYNHVEVHPRMARFTIDEINGIHRTPTSEAYMGPEKTINLFYKDSCTTLSISGLNSVDAMGYSFRWSTGETTPTIKVCPYESTTYSVTVGRGDCITSGSIKVKVTPRCNKDIIVNSPSCPDKAKITWTEPIDTFLNVIDISKGLYLSKGELKFIGELNNHGYYLSTDYYLWSQAQNITKELGSAGVNGHLVTITSIEENNLLYKHIKGTGQWPWIGLENNKGNFRWVTNERVIYKNWEEGEPNNYGGDAKHIVEPYVHMYDFDGKWNDYYNHDKPFIAEFEKPLIQYKQISGPKYGSSQKVGVYTICYEHRNLITTKRDTCCFNVTVRCNSAMREEKGIITVAPVSKVNENYVYRFTVIASPNPSSNGFTLKITSNDNKNKISLKLMDVAGRIIESRSGLTPNQIIQIGVNYRPGIYFIEALQGKNKKTLKLIKQAD